MWAVLNPNNHIKKVTPTCDILLQLMLRGRISLKLRLNLEHEAGLRVHVHVRVRVFNLTSFFSNVD